MTGRRPWPLRIVVWRACVVAAAVVFVWAVHDLRWSIVRDSATFFVNGLALSIGLTVVSMALGLSLGALLAVARSGGPPGVRHLAVAIIEVFRSVPALMVIFWIYFSFPRLIGRPLPAAVAAVIALTLVASAYLAEVIRGGLLSIPRAQAESAYTTGLTRLHTYVWIILPQAVRNMLPAIVATTIMMFKITTLVYVIGLNDFFRAAMLVNNREFEPYVIFSLIVVVYFSICFALSALVRRLDPKYQLTG